MAGPAAARLAASLALGVGIPSDIAAMGVSAENVSPGRACVVDMDSRQPLVGRLQALD